MRSRLKLPLHAVLTLTWAAACWISAAICVGADGAAQPAPLIGYTEFQTNLPGGRHANVRTMRAVVSRLDGSDRRMIGSELVDDPDAWTQFAGWSPDGKHAIVSRGWQNPKNATWEEEHGRFRMDLGQWQLDTCLVELSSGKVVNLSAVERVSHYSGGLFFLSDNRGLGFTALINGVSKPFLMDLDGRNKRNVSGEGGGFAYGYSASPDGKLISYHDNYQIFIAQADGSNKRRVDTGHPFNFGPAWSSDGEWLLFLSGVHHHSNPHIVRRDGTGLKKLVDLNGYQGFIAFLDVRDFHEGSSDTPVWSADGKGVFHTAKSGDNVELFLTTLDARSEQLTKTPMGTLHYHPVPSRDGSQILYGSKRDGVRQLFVMRLADRSERAITSLRAGRAALWPHWQPLPAAPNP